MSTLCVAKAFAAGASAKEPALSKEEKKRVNQLRMEARKYLKSNNQQGSRKHLSSQVAGRLQRPNLLGEPSTRTAAIQENQQLARLRGRWVTIALS